MDSFQIARGAIVFCHEKKEERPLRRNGSAAHRQLLKNRHPWVFVLKGAGWHGDIVRRPGGRRKRRIEVTRGTGPPLIGFRVNVLERSDSEPDEGGEEGDDGG